MWKGRTMNFWILVSLCKRDSGENTVLPCPLPARHVLAVLPTLPVIG
jgi:hypothetical protein